jgi:hypothetical protein
VKDDQQRLAVLFQSTPAVCVVHYVVNFVVRAAACRQQPAGADVGMGRCTPSPVSEAASVALPVEECSSLSGWGLLWVPVLSQAGLQSTGGCCVRMGCGG